MAETDQNSIRGLTSAFVEQLIGAVLAFLPVVFLGAALLTFGISERVVLPGSLIAIMILAPISIRFVNRFVEKPDREEIHFPPHSISSKAKNEGETKLLSNVIQEFNSRCHPEQTDPEKIRVYENLFLAIIDKHDIIDNVGIPLISQIKRRISQLHRVSSERLPSYSLDHVVAHLAEKNRTRHITKIQQEFLHYIAFRVERLPLFWRLMLHTFYRIYSDSRGRTVDIRRVPRYVRRLPQCAGLKRPQILEANRNRIGVLNIEDERNKKVSC